MRYDRDVRYDPERESMAAESGPPPPAERGEYGDAYERPYVPYDAPYRAHPHGYGMGWAGGSLRSRGSFEAGQLRSGRNPYDEFEFEWGDGYVGGRGYGGTNYDYEHGYRTGDARWPTQRRGPGPRRRREPRPDRMLPAPAPSPPRRERAAPPYDEPGRPAHPAAGEMERGTAGRLHGPARYGYGPYHDRLRRRRRDDGEVRDDVNEALFYDTWVDAEAITVDVDEGVVTLSGTLPNFDEVRYATDDAWDVDGVRGVRSELRVEPRSTMERLGRRREFSAGEIASENEAGGTAAPALASGPGEPGRIEGAESAEGTEGSGRAGRGAAGEEASSRGAAAGGEARIEEPGGEREGAS